MLGKKKRKPISYKKENDDKAHVIKLKRKC